MKLENYLCCYHNGSCTQQQGWAAPTHSHSLCWLMTTQLPRPTVKRTGPHKIKLILMGITFWSGDYTGKWKGEFLESFFMKFRMLLTLTWGGVCGGGRRKLILRPIPREVKWPAMIRVCWWQKPNLHLGSAIPENSDQLVSLGLEDQSWLAAGKLRLPWIWKVAVEIAIRVSFMSVWGKGRRSGNKGGRKM